MMRTSAAAAALLLASCVAPAFAQNRPSFDCAKAATVLERKICGSAKLAESDRDMAAAYAALVGRLGGQAKDHLVKDQIRWIGNRRACEANAMSMEDCLASRYRSRTERLRTLGEGAYPFISDQTIVRSGEVDGGSYSIDASYPQFDGASADFTGVSRSFADSTKQIVDDFAASAAVGESFEQAFDLYRLGPAFISVCLHQWWSTAHLVVSMKGKVVDLRTGRPVGLDEIFVSRTGLDSVVRAAVIKEFADNHRGDPPVDLVDQIAKLEASDYLFEQDELVVSLPALALAIGMKGYEVEIPYSTLKPLLRADGLLGGR